MSGDQQEMPMLAGCMMFALATLLTVAPATTQNPDKKPPLILRGEPGPGQHALEPLVGDWDATMTLYAAMGSPDKPYTVKVRTHREWIAGGRYLREVTEAPNYFRQGTLGYSNMDKRYEWVTQDGMNANMMIYLGHPGSGTAQPISMSGSFTDQGILGEKTVGRSVGQRTVITIQDRDHHRVDLYMTPPGERERLVDRKVFVRHQ